MKGTDVMALGELLIDFIQNDESKQGNRALSSTSRQVITIWRHRR